MYFLQSRLKKLLSSKTGFSLVEVLMTSAMVIITGLAMLSMMDIGMKGNKNIQETAAANEFIQVINALFANANACARNFGPAPGQNLTLSGVALTADLVDSTGAVVYDVANPAASYQNGMWLITDYSLSLQSNLTTAPQQQTEVATLNVSLTKNNPGSSVGSTTIVRSLRMWVLLSGPGGNIVSCHALGVSGNIYWNSINGLDINNTNARNVGIGTATPTALLDLFTVGTPIFQIRTLGTAPSQQAVVAYVTKDDGNPLGSATNKGWHLTARGDAYGGGENNNLVAGFWNGSTWTHGLNITGSGSVGIGTVSPQVKLDVAGSIRAGGGATIGSACSPEGALAYDNGAHRPVYCSDTLQWSMMGGGYTQFTVAYSHFSNPHWYGAQVSCPWYAAACPAGYVKLVQFEDRAGRWANDCRVIYLCGK